MPFKAKNPFAERRAFTLVEMMIVVSIIGLLAVIAVTNLILARDTSRLNVVKRNLREIDSAKGQWAMERRQPEGTPASEYLRGGTAQELVQETHTPNPVGTPPTATTPAP